MQEPLALPMGNAVQTQSVAMAIRLLDFERDPGVNHSRLFTAVIGYSQARLQGGWMQIVVSVQYKAPDCLGLHKGGVAS